MALFSRIGYTYLPTSNIDEAIEWYVNQLGFTLKSPKFNDGVGVVAVLSLPDGYSVVLLVETNNETNAAFSRNGKPFQTLALNCPDLPYTHEMLKNNGVDVSEIIVRSEEAKYFIIKDPDGNLIEAAWSVWD
ncbi:VOC family protein [Bacillus sp. JCM 19034]|uniref:VOC family protein n=1 Tax=Bacillus sp. JCM 19034 TaxID=1481928 RepID=UPI0007854ED6|nr:VOC family protein [Bacillus sp. JCM 19034]